MAKTLEWYLSRGYDRRTAEYFLNGKRTIKNVIPNDDFTLLLTFDNGEQKIFDVAPIIKKSGVFKHIKQIEDFKRVYLDGLGCPAWDIDPNIDSNKVWANKIDISADSCYIEGEPVLNKETIEAIEELESGKSIKFKGSTSDLLNM